MKINNKYIVIIFLLVLNIVLLYKYYSSIKNKNIYNINKNPQISFDLSNYDDNEMLDLINKKWINEKINLFIFVSSKGCSLCEQKIMEFSELLINRFPSLVKIIRRKNDNTLLNDYKKLSKYFYSPDVNDSPSFITPTIILLDKEANIILKYEITPEKLAELNELYRLVEGIIRLTEK